MVQATSDNGNQAIQGAVSTPASASRTPSQHRMGALEEQLALAQAQLAAAETSIPEPTPEVLPRPEVLNMAENDIIPPPATPPPMVLRNQSWNRSPSFGAAARLD